MDIDVVFVFGSKTGCNSRRGGRLSFAAHPPRHRSDHRGLARFENVQNVCVHLPYICIVVHGPQLAGAIVVETLANDENVPRDVIDAAMCESFTQDAKREEKRHDATTRSKCAKRQVNRRNHHSIMHLANAPSARTQLLPNTANDLYRDQSD